MKGKYYHTLKYRTHESFTACQNSPLSMEVVLILITLFGKGYKETYTRLRWGVPVLAKTVNTCNYNSYTSC